MRNLTRLIPGLCIGAMIIIVLTVVNLLAQHELMSFNPYTLFFLFFLWGPTLWLEPIVKSPIVPYVSVFIYYNLVSVLIRGITLRWRIVVISGLVLTHVVAVMQVAKSLEFAFPLTREMLQEFVK